MSDVISPTPETNQRPVIEPALALLEFNSIAAGMFSGDAMAKRAELAVIFAGTVQPGRYLVLVGGAVGEVEEALTAGLAAMPEALTDHVYLPGVHPDVVRGLTAGRLTFKGDALGIVETSNVPAVIQAADAGIKGADVQIVEVRLADGLGGKGLVLFDGKVSDVEAAVEIASSSIPLKALVRQVVISQLHPEMAVNIQATTRFGPRLGWTSE